MSISSDWTKGLSGQSKEDLEYAVRNSGLLLNRLKDIALEREREVHKLEIKMDSYDSPSWSHKQAHLNGRGQELQWLLNLITLDPK